jgi:hypothetical protein
MPKKSAPYGSCYKCDSPVEIPGLDAYLCSGCGWVRGENKRKNSQSETAKRVEISFVKKPEPTLFDF